MRLTARHSARYCKKKPGATPKPERSDLCKASVGIAKLCGLVRLLFKAMIALNVRLHRAKLLLLVVTASRGNVGQPRGRDTLGRGRFCPWVETHSYSTNFLTIITLVPSSLRMIWPRSAVSAVFYFQNSSSYCDDTLFLRTAN
jgi:hypothetical protein